MEIRQCNKILMIIIWSIFVALLTVQIPNIIGKLTDAFLNNRNIDYFLLTLFAFLILSNLLALINEYLTERIGCDYANETRQKLINKYFTINYEANMEYQNGDYRQIFSNDINNLQLMFSNTIPTCVQQVTMFIGAVYFLFCINSWLLVCVLLSTCIYIFPFKFFGRKQHQAIHDFRKAQADLQGIVDNTSDNKEEIYQYDNINFFARIYNELQQKWEKAFLQIDISKNLFKTFPRILDALSPALALLVGGVMSMNHIISMGQLVSVIGLISYINAPFKAFFSIFVDLQQAMISKKSIESYLNSTEITTGSKEIGEVKKIAIFYGSKLVVNALPGMHIYLIGGIGSGKTTFLRGLCGEQNNSKYQYIFNNYLSTKIKKEFLKKQIAFVDQQTIIIQGTIRDNIFFAENTHLSEEEALFLSNWAKRFPEGLDTKIAPGAYQLSGGERQVICIFRSLVQSHSILLLDEITSSMDHETARQIKTLVNKHRDTIIFEALHRTEEIGINDTVMLFKGVNYPPLFGKYGNITGD
ncbi:ABC transporter transmembrane domain-containing protein [Bombilactobacillus bombi]|uniref:ABC transporter transmembrane domain-containing protein n=1 Tax=Bombilactobacillus bombi TaxID=1303590 RepID=UPI0015E604EF|nr:ABC transporter ATP-binding protein [Bombilactobacillus bombi]MBA1433902.1 ABC transporter ATP-binding protein [Bombilactobacillus bombi]